MERFEIFYTAGAEGGKFLFYVALFALAAVGFVQRRRGSPSWAGWVHAAIALNFVVGIVYSGVRMLTTDEVSDMLVRRFFAWEAWFNLGGLSFYFLFWWIWTEVKAFLPAS